MTKLNHSRPYLRLIDNLQRESLRIEGGLGTKPNGLPPPPENAFRDFEEIGTPKRPSDDANLTADQVRILESLFDAHTSFVIAYGMMSPFLGKPSKKQKAAIVTAERMLIETATEFVRFCAREAHGGSLSTFHWLQEFCNFYHRRGFGVFDWLTAAVLENGLEIYFWAALRGSEQDQAELTSLVREIAQVA